MHDGCLIFLSIWLSKVWGIICRMDVCILCQWFERVSVFFWGVEGGVFVDPGEEMCVSEVQKKGKLIKTFSDSTRVMIMGVSGHGKTTFVAIRYWYTQTSVRTKEI